MLSYLDLVNINRLPTVLLLNTTSFFTAVKDVVVPVRPRLKMFFVGLSGEAVPGMDQGADSMEAEMGFQQVPVLQQNLAARLQQQIPLQAGIPGGLQPPSSPYDEAELDALAEIERIEREAASEKCSKEVQDKGVQRGSPVLALWCFYLLKL